jgi:ribonuclease HI
MSSEVIIFTDASYNPQTKIGVCGFRLKGSQTLNMFRTDDIKNTQCEMLGMIKAIEYANQTLKSDVIIYTDCKRIVDLFDDKNQLDSRYSFFYQILNTCKIKIDIKHIGGHKKKSLKMPLDLEFSIIDKAVRNELRKLVKEI